MTAAAVRALFMQVSFGVNFRPYRRRVRRIYKPHANVETVAAAAPARGVEPRRTGGVRTLSWVAPGRCAGEVRRGVSRRLHMRAQELGGGVGDPWNCPGGVRFL